MSFRFSRRARPTEPPDRLKRLTPTRFPDAILTSPSFIERRVPPVTARRPRRRWRTFTPTAVLPFGIGEHPDKKNSNWSIAGIGQGGVALPDRDYYLSDAADRVAVRAKYVAHVARTLRLLGGVYADAAAASAAADSVRV